MGDNLPKFLCRLASRLRGIKAEKRNIVIFATFLILGIGLFFYVFFASIASAKNTSPSQVETGSLVPVVKIGSKTVDKKVPTGVAPKACQDRKIKDKTSENTLGEKEIRDIVGGHPMENMTAHIAKRDKKVAAFLVAIAKKESDWGTHSPKKSGRECFNYWGYRGKENTTESGYSCFDNPEQAVQVVGDRIENLLNKKIDTPTKMVVWKCGRDCEATGGQAAANKWIADVAHIYVKLQS